MKQEGGRENGDRFGRFSNTTKLPRQSALEDLDRSNRQSGEERALLLPLVIDDTR
jgi:hypothetical protein